MMYAKNELKVLAVTCAVAAGLGTLAAFGATRVGVINWDCSPPSDTWFGGYQTRSLSPARYRYLTPYYADAKGPDEISYHRRTPAEYDRELQYAIDAGIDYFAYCWYGEDPHAKRVPLHSGRSASCEDHLWEITWARQFHMKSSLREKIGLCAIVLGYHVYTDEEVMHLAEAMREPCYEKVAEGRPLLYIFGDVTKGEILARIRRAARTVGVAEPFVVAMHGTRKSLPATGDRSVQARSAYAPPAPPKGGAFLRYPDMYAAIRRVNAAWIDQGFDIVPAFATGRDHWPRIEHQVPWTDNPPMRYASPATERELVECAKDFKAFMDANRAKCPLDHVLTYAWNEFEEGAYICPLWAPNGGADVSRLKAFAKVARIFKGEQGVTAVPDDPLPDLADVRKRLSEIFKDCKDSFRHEWFAMRLEAAERLAALPNRTPLMQAELDEFRASFRDALAHWANDPLNPAVKPVEINARDFGVKGDGVTDDALAFARAAEAVRKLGGRPSVLRIPAGLYFLNSAGTSAGVHLDLTCLTNCAVVGESPETTRFEFGLYGRSGVALDRSVNTTLSNADFSWREAPFAQCVVENYEPSNCTAVVRYHPGTLKPDDPRYRKADHAQVCGLFTATGEKILSRGATPFFDLRADDLGGGCYRIYFDTKNRPGMNKFRPLPGDVIVLPDRSNALHGIRMRESEFCNVTRVWFRNARASTISGAGAYYATADHCRTFPKSPDLVFSSNADTFFNARGSHLAHCEFQNMNDDGANSLTRGTAILSKEGARTVVTYPQNGRIGEGSVAQILQATNGRFFGDFRIVALQRFKAKNGGARWKITFDRDLPAELKTSAEVGAIDAATRYALSHGQGTVADAADLLFFPLAYGTGFTALDNRIHDLRGCGINVQCPHSIVDGNVIANVGMGMKMTGLTEWFEGPPPYNVVVRNNVFRNCGTGISSRFNTINRKLSKECPIRWVEIVSNRLENVARPFALHNLSDETVRDNEIVAARGDGMIPFLAITGKPTEAEVRAKVAAIQAQGIDSFLIYARSGLELEYMGEEWLKLNEWFCDEAEKRGMKVWLYDEYNWPSGTCKGRVPNENDAWRYTEYGVYRNPDGSYRWTTALAPAGWVNVCEPAAVARFIELTHEVYAKRLDRWFKNKTILGIFTDEPGHPTRVTFPDGKPLVSFRKYSGLEDEYKAATGRELKADVEKWLATKEGSSSVASTKEDDVWSVYLDLMGKRFRTAYFDQLRAWCDAHGILLTGHMISENDLYGSARCNGNPILCLRGESLPGMDEIHTRCEPDRIEWVTYNVARQAILHRGNGGLAELYACGPANHVPATLRFVMWMCAFHGIDHYITCMDVMDEKGLVEKHGYLSCMGPIHPWYEKHARVLADEARVAAEWARKTVAEREVAVRYPNRTAQQLAIAGRTKAVPGPNLQGLLRTLELNQFTCRLVDEDESSDLPLVFTCQVDGRYAEERTGKKDLTAENALALCRDRLLATFRVLEAVPAAGSRMTDAINCVPPVSGSGGSQLVATAVPAADVLVRTYTDGSAAVLNLQPFTDRTLVAERNGTRTTFTLPARGVVLFANGSPGGLALPSAATSLANVDWDLTLDAPNIRRVNFDPSRKGALTVAAPLKGVRLLTRNCAMSYAVTSSGRPIGLNEQPAKGDTVIRHIAEPYAFEMDGTKVESPEPCTSLRPCYDPLYRQTKPFDLAAGEHAFAIASGEADSNFFLPALFLTGDFAVFNGVVMSRPKGKVKLGPLAASGLADFTGTATWSAEVTVPGATSTHSGCAAKMAAVPVNRLRLATGGRLTQVKLDGKDLGVRAWAPFEWDVPADLAGKKAKLEISISTSVQPMFGDPANGTWDMRFWNAVSGPDGPCGLLAADWLEFR